MIHEHRGATGEGPVPLLRALPPVPEDVGEMVRRTAASVRQERAGHRVVPRIAVIALLLVLVTMTVAVAAGLSMGWASFLEQHYRVAVPPLAREALDSAAAPVVTVGPLTFTLTERLADGHYLWHSAVVTATDGAPVLLTDEAGDSRVGSSGEQGRALASALGIPPETSWLEAARLTGLPLYEVRALATPEASYDGFDAMEEALPDGTGRLVCFSQSAITGTEGLQALPVTCFLRVSRIDPDTGEVLEKWVEQFPDSIPLSPRLAERTYHPETPVIAGGYRLEGIDAAQYVTGIYLTLRLTAPPDATEDSVWESNLWSLLPLTDAEGTPFPEGMSLTGSLSAEHLPEVTVTVMISGEALPDALWAGAGETRVLLR